MASISSLDVARAASTGGFPSDQIVTAVAIAYAESGWDPTATHANSDGSTDYGLWQINSVHGFPELSNGQWSDPATNGRLAHQVWQSQGWGAWSTHSPSDPIGYARYIGAIPLANDAAVALGITKTTGVTNPLNPVASVEQLLKTPLSILDYLSKPAFWQRAGKFVVGGFLVIAAGFVLLQGVIAPATSKIVSATGVSRKTGM